MQAFDGALHQDQTGMEIQRIVGAAVAAAQTEFISRASKSACFLTVKATVMPYVDHSQSL
jgi:hypothetical protein